MTEDDLKAIEARANTPPFTADNDVANMDVLTLVAEVRRLRVAMATAERSPLFARFLKRGAWDASSVDIVWRHDGHDVREQADWLKDLWYAIRETMKP
jgi:hypothetical protein